MSSSAVLFRGTITIIVTAFLMHHFDNSTLPSFLFFGFTLSYELMKIAAVYAFPILSDPKYSPSNTLSLLNTVPRWLMAYTIISGKNTNIPSSERLFWACFIFVLSMTLMMISETQKAVFLKFQKKVVTTGVFARTRNPEVLAEICILAAFAILVNSPLSYLLAAVISLPIFSHIAMKKEQLVQEEEEEWKKYKHNTWMIFPKILGDRNVVNIIFYILSVACGSVFYQYGGFTNLLKK